MAFNSRMIIISGAEYELQRMIAANKAGLEAAAEYWWRNIMPGHFTLGAGRKYGYQARKGDNEPPRLPTGPGGSMRSNRHYSWRKRRKFGHNKPLVWSGESEQSAKRSYRITVKREKKSGLVKCRLAMEVPYYFYAYKPGQPDKYAELVRMTEAENRELTRIHNEAVEAMTGPVRGGSMSGGFASGVESSFGSFNSFGSNVTIVTA